MVNGTDEGDKILKKIKKVFYSTLGVILILYGIYYVTKENNQLKKYPRYTIASTQSVFHTGKSGSYIKYYFTVAYRQYYGDIEYKNNIVVPNGRYYVVYSSKSPKYNRLIIDKTVPDSITNLPTNGWDKLPR